MSDNVDFVVYFADIIKAKKLKKREIATRTGLSVDYAYKLLNGNKKTEERDYIIALCVAAEFSLDQIQIALHAYPMPTLNQADKRDAVIIKCVEAHRSILELNEALEAKGQPVLRTSNDMQKHEIVREIERKIISHGDYQMGFSHYGNAPFDRHFIAEIKVTDSNGKNFYLKTIGDCSVPRYLKNPDNYWAVNETATIDIGSERQKIWFLVTNETSYPELASSTRENQIDDSSEDFDGYEEYYSLLELEDSIYFKYFVHMKTMVEDKIKDYMDMIDDTKYFGARFGCKYENGHRIAYTEAFNRNQPEKEEYIQVVDYDGKITYTATHQSIYMQLELGELYAQHFGVDSKVKPYLEVGSIEELGDEYWYFKDPFIQIQEMLAEEYPNRRFTVMGDDGKMHEVDVPPNLTILS